jgi:hypothetical protein
LWDGWMTINSEVDKKQVMKSTHILINQEVVVVHAIHT